MQCSNCGGQYDEGTLACPFCGAENQAEADKRYQEELKAISDEKAGLHFLPKRIAVHISKRAAVMILAGVLIVIAGALAKTMADGMADQRKYDTKTANKKVLEADFKQGKYDKMAAFLNKKRCYDNGYQKYKEVAKVYESYMTVQKNMAGFEEGKKIEDYQIRDSLYYGSQAIKEAKTAADDTVIRGNEAVIKDFSDKVSTYLDKLQLTDDEIEKMAGCDIADPYFDDMAQKVFARLNQDKKSETE